MLNHALGVTVPVTGVALPLACVAVTGFASSVTQGLLVAAATAAAWAASGLVLRDDAKLSALTGLAIGAPLALTLVFRPYVVDGALGRGALVFAVVPWVVVTLATRFARNYRAAPQGDVPDTTPASLELVWTGLSALFDWPVRLFASPPLEAARTSEAAPENDVEDERAEPQSTEPEPAPPKKTKRSKKGAR
jgi:hypothetical protein